MPISTRRVIGARRVVGVQRREHEVAGQRGLDGDLRRLAVADLADHDDVGVGAQHRAQAGREVRPAFVLTWTCVMPVELVLDRVLDRDDVLLERVERAERRVERRRLARARRAGRRARRRRPGGRRARSARFSAAHAELLERHDDVVLVEDADDDRLAVDARQRHDAQVDVAAVDGQADAAVLRACGARRCRGRHDLHAADDAGDHAPRHVRRLDEHAVDAEAHAQLGAVGLEVDVGGALLDGLGDDLVDELDDRRVVGGLAQVDDLARARRPRPRRGRRDDVVQARQARDEPAMSSRLGDRGADLVAGHQRDVVDREDVRRVGHRDEQRALVDEARPAPPRSAWPRRWR